MSSDVLSPTPTALEPANYRERLRFLPWYFWLLSVLILFLNAAQWGVLYWQVPYTESVVFLHYTIYFGVDMTGAWWRLFVLPGAGLVLLMMNWVVMLKNYYRRPLIAWVALITSLLLNILLAIGLYFIIQINI